MLISCWVMVVPLGHTMTSFGFETIYSPQVPLLRLANTDTDFPWSSASSHSQMTPEPSKPMMGNPSLRIPQRPRQKKRSEGLIGAYFILMRNCPLLRVGTGHWVSTGNLPYFWIWTALIQLYMLFALAALIAILLTPTSANLELETDLPMLIEKIRSGTARSFEIVQLQSFRYELSLQSRIKNNISSDCHIHPPELTISPITPMVLLGNKGRTEFSFSMVDSIVFKIEGQSVTAYKVDWQGGRLSRGEIYELKDSNIKMVQVSEEDKVFIFTSKYVYELEPSKNSRVKEVIQRHQAFRAFKVVRNEELILELSSDQGINVYSVDFNLNITLLGTVKAYHNHTLHIADAYYRQNHLLVVDHKKGVFLFQRNGNSFTQMNRFSLDVEEEIDYRFIVMGINNLYLVFEGNGQAAVLECLFTYSKLLLIRYFKGYDSIRSVGIFNSKLLIQGNNRVDLLHVNKDPRIVPTLLNGYTYSHVQHIESFILLQNNQFLLASASGFQIASLQSKDPLLECSFAQTGLNTFIVERECEQNINDPFYHVCLQVDKISVQVNSASRDSYYWLLLIVTGLFVIGIVTLIYWRGEELQRIQKIFRKIKYFKEKFQPKTEQVEFEEVDHAYSDELHARSRNWEEVGPESTQRERCADEMDHGDSSDDAEETNKDEEINREEGIVPTQKDLGM